MFHSLPSVHEDAHYAGSKVLRKYKRQLKKINRISDHYQGMSDDELKRHARGFGVRYNKTHQLDIVKLYACAREVTFRLLGKRHYDVQILGALAALERQMIQMSTGSGKTITLILPALAHGLTRKGCNVLTVNDYLAKRDWEETRVVYDYFGLSSAYVNSEDAPQVQAEGFACDITYSTNSTLGFAYLHSALASGIGQDIKVITRPLHVAIIDEVDEILMDDARNPLIIAEGRDTSEELTTVTHLGRKFKVQEIVDKLRHLSNLEYDMDDHGQPFIGESTWDEIYRMFKVDRRLFRNPKFLHIIDNAITALFTLKPYTDYIVSDTPDPDSGSRIILIDKATGRLSRGRTLNDNLHAFVEMKEGVYTGSGSTATLQITYQVLFNLFHLITGVTGTLGTSFKEFEDIYQCGVVVIPDRFENKLKQTTRLYPTQEHLMTGLLHEVRWATTAGHPILIGCASDIEASLVANHLRQEGIDHRLLLSIDTDEEQIIASAGERGSIVVTTDIMGRGTDIHLSDETAHIGLCVFQVGPRPNSRVERQFAGRAGRQGSPGVYYRLVSLTDIDAMGWMPSDIEVLRRIWRQNRLIAEDYQDDILWHGYATEYNQVVNLINQALNAKESAFSVARVQDYKCSNMVDLIQTAIIAQLDECRKAIALSLDGYHHELLYQVAKWTLPSVDREKKRRINQRAQDLVGYPITELQNRLYDFTNHVCRTVIYDLRQYADQMDQTVKLASQTGFPTPPEQHMEELIRHYLVMHESDLTLQLAD